MRLVVAGLVVLWLGSAATFVRGIEPTPLTNPKGQEPSDLVKQVMNRYGIEEAKPEFIQSGTWVYASETSAVVAMETNVRAQATLRYGEGNVLDKLLDNKKRHYIHVFHLAGLKPDTGYGFEMGVVDKMHDRADSGRQSFRTKTMKGVVRIPDDLNGPSFELDKLGTTYLVTRDITAPQSALNISAADITLDLGGHTIVYNDEAMRLPTDSFNRMIKESAFGVRVRARDIAKVRILNGTIIQGKGNDESSYGTIGFNPIYMSGGAGSEIAGVRCVYSGRQLSGIMTHWAGADITIHHNVIEDTGKLIANRHRQNKAIAFACPTGGKVYNNLSRKHYGS
jgi:hypothetical protein